MSSCGFRALGHKVGFMRQKIKVPSVIALLVVVCATIAGWQHYRAEPFGDLLYTANSQCPNMANSFATAYLLVLLVTGCVASIVAVSSFLGSRFVGNPNWSCRLKAVAQGALLLVVLLGGAALVSYSADVLFQLQIRPGCVVK
jgi:hypothetical protein